MMQLLDRVFEQALEESEIAEMATSTCDDALIETVENFSDAEANKVHLFENANEDNSLADEVTDAEMKEIADEYGDDDEFEDEEFGDLNCDGIADKEEDF